MIQIKKIIIEGERVHHVGYRPFLLRKARELEIPNYDAENIVKGRKQKVIVSLGGEENQLSKFVEFAKENYPEKAKVSSVREVEPPERVMPVDEYQKVLDSEQHNTMIQAGLAMIDMQKQTVEMQKQTVEMQKQTVEMQKQTIGEVRIVGGKIDYGFEKMDQNFNRMDTKYDKVSDKMDSIDNTLKELTNAILKLAEKSA